jgi:hypothetical protein
MTESNEKQEKYLGVYFDRDSILRLSRWADIVSWVMLTIYVLFWLFSMVQFLAQYFSGMMGDKGATFLMIFNLFSPYILQPLPGVFYFFGLQGLSKALLIFMDMEDNTRRAARK